MDPSPVNPPPRRGSSSPPDIMNDPAFATNNGNKGKGLDEPDTCRICRGEGTDDEQLFYPCKCSGSIKFVHQGCLMQWLTHSQKKYCELCKTQFRFTKLYDPNMPKDLPVPVFVKELVIHACRSLVTWLRFVLVTFVWLGWLPWSMRAIWRGLFWLADGRWPHSEVLQNPSVNGTMSSLAAQGTSAVTHTLASNFPITSTIPDGAPTGRPELRPVSSLLNFTTGEPLVYAVAKAIFANAFTLSSSSSTPAIAASTGNSSHGTSLRTRQPSWLSDIAFLNNITPFPTMNNILIDTLEGQLITLLVVISFILVFLIREWVVQQQPVINLAQEQDANGRLINRVAELVHDHEEEDDSGEDSDEDESEEEEVVGFQLLNPRRRIPTPNNMPTPNNTPASESSDQAPLAQDETNLSTPSADVPSPTISGPSTTNRDRSPVPQISHQFDPRPLADKHDNNQNEPNVDGSNVSQIADIDKPFQFLGEIKAKDNSSSLNRESQPKRVPGNSTDLNNDQSNTQFQYRNTSPMASDSIDQNGFHTFPQLVPDKNLDGSSMDTSSQAARPESRINSIPGETEELGVPGPSSLPHSSSNQTRREAGEDLDPLNLPDLQISQNEVESLDSEGTAEAQDGNVSSPNQDLIHPSTPVRPNDELPTPGPHPMGFFDRVANWCWGGIPGPLPDTENQENEAGEGEPARGPQIFLARDHQRHGPGHLNADNGQQPAIAIPPNEDGDANDADAVEDADDLEGIMELIGMHGPIFGLLQNGVFSALLISFTVTVGIWLPYLWGKIALVLLANPIRLFVSAPLTLLSIVADVAVDILIGSFAYVVYMVNVMVRNLLGHIERLFPTIGNFSAANAVTFASLSLMEGSGERIKRVVTNFFTFHESDLPMFSVLSHEALKLHQTRIATVIGLFYKTGKTVLYDIPLRLIYTDDRISLVKKLLLIDPLRSPHALLNGLKNVSGVTGLLRQLKDWPSIKINLSQHSPHAVDYELASWNTRDRIIAIIVGYCFVSLLSAAYLRFSAFVSGTHHEEQRGDGAVAEMLRQAGGVMKVIVIIGIEMIVFPLYCGILLDISLLPLFENTTLSSRINFTMASPMTSLFVHWFIGTCYMFHFALFVSMCRKIMRGGVLYFIRDPDDPTFHPVRDVLERSISTQLRKIGFSALVYGGLVTICLGGVVWSLASVFRGVLPVHWSSNEPVLEFPVDLLFYNFVMPLAIRSIKPSDGLHQMYDWWFHKCARALRLTNFLFGDRKTDEQGHLVLKSWQDIFSALKGLTNGDNPTIEGESEPSTESRGERPGFIRDGRIVRAPASDQVRIPKGEQVFVEVNENNERLDGKPDSEDGLHGKANEMFATVYIPPNFRARIFAFLLLLWLFAAATGVGSTIIPLVIGRRMISFLFPSHIRVNDIYALSAGAYTAGSLYYAFIHSQKGISAIKDGLRLSINSPGQAVHKVYSMVTHALRLIYLSGAVALLLPSLFALVMELYFLVPLHTYLNASKTHVIHFVQDWTLGVLYVRMAVRFMLRHPASRPATALRAIVRNGWTKPDVNLATRAFIVPATILSLIAVFGPLPIGFVLNSTKFRASAGIVQSQVYRYSFPGFLLLIIIACGVRRLQRQIGIWRVSIRDDVYLIGERLHNFGGKRARNVGAARRMITS